VYQSGPRARRTERWGWRFKKKERKKTIHRY